MMIRRSIGQFFLTLVLAVGCVGAVSAALPAQAAGFVPCGGPPGTDDPATTDSVEDAPCTLCHVMLMAKRIVDWTFKVMTFFAIAIIVAMGILYIVSAGDEGMIKTAKEGIKAALYGFAIILLAWLIINVVLSIVAKNLSSLGASSDKWFEFKCSTVSKAGTVTLTGAGSGYGNIGGGTPAGSGTLDCKTGKCASNPQVAAAVKNNSAGIDSNLLMTMIDGGEGCNPNLSSDGRHSCGYGQVLPSNRRRYCALSGTDADCQRFKEDVQLDINCAAAFIKGYIGNEKECYPFKSGVVEPLDASTIMNSPGSAGFIGACYNAGAAGARSGRCGTDNYCVRIQKYYNSCLK